MHLFRATKINSEIKYVANSIVQEAPRYAYPPQTDIHGWQNGVQQQLDEWYAKIPSAPQNPNEYMQLVCRLRYHSLCVLLLRPSPAIPKPTAEALVRCHSSATEIIGILDEMYRKNLLFHNWISLHGLVLAVLTLFYCVKAEPQVSRDVQLDGLRSTVSSALSILSATGEHWSAAKRCRTILEHLSKSIIQGLYSHATASSQPAPSQMRSRSSRGQPAAVPRADGVGADVLGITFGDQFANTGMDTLFEPFESMFPGEEFGNMDIMMQSLFQDFIPAGVTF